MIKPENIYDFGYQPCSAIIESMEKHLQSSKKEDSIWLGEHHTIVTLGRLSDQKSIFNQSLPSLKVSRGGQATLHMPGQLMFYPLISLKQNSLNIRSWIQLLENTVILSLEELSLHPFRCQGEPGVFLKQGKIASVGVKVSKFWSYYGLCLNVSCNLSVFKSISPCGMLGRPMTSLYHCGQPICMSSIKKIMINNFNKLLKEHSNNS